MYRVCSFFMIVINLVGSISVSAASIRAFTPEQIKEMVMDKAANGHETTALALFNLYFNEQQRLQDRVSIVRSVVNDSGWRFLSDKTKLAILRVLLEKGPLSAPLERELVYLIAHLGTYEAIEFLKNYVHTTSDVTFYDDDYFPSLIPLWRRWYLTRRWDGQILLGEGVMRGEELSLLASLWAASVRSCELRLDRP